MSISVRSIQPQDRDALYELVCQANEQPPDKQLFSTLFEGGLHSTTHKIALITKDDALIGWGELEVGYTLSSGGLVGTMTELYIAPPFRGKGAGSALLIYLANAAKKMGCRQLLANCSKVNVRSRSFLERNGFVLSKAQFSFRLHRT